MNTSEQIKKIIDENFVVDEVDFQTLSLNYPVYYIDVLNAVSRSDVVSSRSPVAEITGFAFVDEVSGTLMLFSVSKKFQRRGYGKKLLETIAKHTELKALNVRKSNEAAISLYESVGFSKKKIIRNYYSYSSVNEDAILMTYSPLKQNFLSFMYIPNF